VSHYDLIVIGGGAGGFGAAITASDLGAKTALVHAGLPLGGTSWRKIRRQKPRLSKRRQKYFAMAFLRVSFV
jgi:thioredoxin reductase